MKDIEVHDPPTDTSHLFVRPEVRAWALRALDLDVPEGRYALDAPARIRHLSEAEG